MTKRWKNRPTGSNWGEFGADDQIGRLNLLTPAKVLEGIREVREGRVFCLSLPLDHPGGTVLNPRRHPPELRPTLRDGAPNMNYALARQNPAYTDVVSDDMALLTLQYSTQWDSLAHMGQLFDADGDGIAEMVYYNGFRAGEHVVAHGDDRRSSHGATGALALGIETMAAAGVQGRGVLVDLNAHFGRSRVLVGYDELMHVMAADRVVVEPGDMLCLRTGFDELLLEMGGRPDPDLAHGSCAVLDGQDRRLLEWVTDSGVAALIADNYAVEDYPRDVGDAVEGPRAAFPLHEHCLFKLGVPLGELWLLSPLAHFLRERGRSRFLLTAPPLRLPGAVGSPLTPVATV